MSSSPKPLSDNEVEATYDLVHQAAMNGVDSVFKSEDWRRHPMFLNELPEDVDNDRYLGAFQHLTYDNETPDTIAANFKELGNDLFRQGKQHWLTAANWWSRALEEKMTDKKLRSILHSNRATVSLGLGQYQRAALDANWAIENDKYNKKAYVRAAHAYQGMGDWDKAIAAANAGLEIMEEKDPLAKQLKDVLENANNQIKNGSQRANQFFSSVTACASYFSKVRFSIGEFCQHWQANWDLILQFDEDKEETIWPLAMAFDEVLQVDFCEAFPEKTPLKNIVNMAFPGVNADATAPLWDTQGRYKTDTVIVYITTHATKGRWGRETKPGQQENILIDQDACLHDIFTQKDYVIPGYPIIYFAVKNSDFIAQLNLKEVILAGGRRRKLNEQEKAWLVPAPHPEDNKRKEHDGTLHIDNEQKK